MDFTKLVCNGWVVDQNGVYAAGWVFPDPADMAKIGHTVPGW